MAGDNGPVDGSIPEMDENAASPGEQPGEASSHEQSPHPVIEDVEALVGDVLNYFDAEMAFQKTRLRFAGQSIKTALGAGVLALVLVLLAVFGLVFGLILALTPLITAWGATAVVVGALLLLAYLLVRKAMSSIKLMKAELKPETAPAEQEPDNA